MRCLKSETVTLVWRWEYLFMPTRVLSSQTRTTNIADHQGRKRALLEAAAAEGDGGATDPRVANKLRGTGAHVVAPCPHDGVCPLQVS